MSFFSSFYHSLFDFEWLKALRTNRRGAWRYFLTLVTVITILESLLFASVIPALRLFRDSIEADIPAFSATVADGRLSVTGLEQPFLFESPEEDFAFLVDSTTTTLPTRMERYGTSLSVLADRFEVRSPAGGTERESFTSFPSGTLTRDQVVSAFRWITSVKGIALIFVMTVVVIFIGTFVFNLLVILFTAFITWLIARFAKRSWRFGELFTVGLYAITLPVALGVVLSLFGFAFSFIPRLAFLAFMAAMVLTKEKETTPPTSSTTPDVD